MLRTGRVGEGRAGEGRAGAGCDGRASSVAPELRQLVAFRELNLIGTWPMTGPFQVILCRNAVVYFDEPTQAATWSRFRPLVAPGGHLYVGHSDRMSGDAARYFDSVGITAYRRLGAARP